MLLRKRIITTTLVHLLDHTSRSRGMTLLPFATRCVQKGEVHELVTTDQTNLNSESKIDRVGFLGFIEINVAGVIERGDEVVVEGAVIGKVAGFDDCHYPNHYNIIIATRKIETSSTLRLSVEGIARFIGSNHDEVNIPNKPYIQGDNYDKHKYSTPN